MRETAAYLPTLIDNCPSLAHLAKYVKANVEAAKMHFHPMLAPISRLVYPPRED